MAHSSILNASFKIQVELICHERFKDTATLLLWSDICGLDIPHQKSDCLPTESECSETDESESAEEVIKHPDGKVRRLLTTQGDVDIQM